MTKLIEVKELETDFLPWLSSVLQVIYRLENGDTKAAVKVPCGTCTLCCQNNRTVLTEEEAQNPIYKAEWHGLDASKEGVNWFIPKDKDGRCIHLGEGCNIFEDRPATCRTFDCRKRIVAGMRDPHTLEMAKQWDMSRWFSKENELFISAIQSAALNYQRADQEAGISKITAYAITHFQQYLGPVYLKMKEKKS